MPKIFIPKRSPEARASFFRRNYWLILRLLGLGQSAKVYAPIQVLPKVEAVIAPPKIQEPIEEIKPLEAPVFAAEPEIEIEPQVEIEPKPGLTEIIVSAPTSPEEEEQMVFEHLMGSDNSDDGDEDADFDFDFSDDDISGL